MKASRENILEAKRRLPLPQLMAQLGKGDAAKESARCPFHKDSSNSFSIFQSKDGGHGWKCFAGCGQGDEIDFLAKAKGYANGSAVTEFLALAGVTNGAPPTHRETFDWPKCVADFTQAEAQKLAAWRGLSVEFVRWLHQQGAVGLHEGKLALANHGDGGKVVSAHVRLETRDWIFKPKGQRTAPLVFGDTKAAGFALVFESQWDAFAVMDKLGWHAANGLPDTAVLITRGASNGKLIRGQLAPDATCYAFKQNDAATEKKPIPAGDVWLADIAAVAGCRVLNVATPAPHKDANDWTRAGATKVQIEAAITAAKLVQPQADQMPGNDEPDTARADTSPPAAKSLGELQRRTVDDPNELLRTGYLCRGGGLLLAAPTGIGKSSFAIQAQIMFALGRAMFGIQPVRPLRSLYIQAENDEGDLADMRDGVIAGLGLSADELDKVYSNIFTAHENTRTLRAFFENAVAPLLELHKPDLLWIDPALSYLGGEASSQKDVGHFLRNLLNPLLTKFNCGCAVIHHTNKPPTGKEKSKWSAGDFAYLGSGSAEWANWARAVLAIRSVGSHDVFELQAAKRGARLGWHEADGTKAFAKYIAHATEPGVICWREVTADDLDTGGRPKQFDADEVLSLLPPQGLTAGKWQQAALKECGIKEATFHRHRRELAKAERVLKSKASGKWQPVTQQP